MLLPTHWVLSLLILPEKSWHADDWKKDRWYLRRRPSAAAAESVQEGICASASVEARHRLAACAVVNASQAASPNSVLLTVVDWEHVK